MFPYFKDKSVQFSTLFYYFFLLFHTMIFPSLTKFRIRPQKIFNGKDQRIPVRELTVSVSMYKTSAFEILDKGEFSLLLSLSQMDFCIIAYYPVLIYQSILLCCHFSLQFFAAVQYFTILCHFFKKKKGELHFFNLLNKNHFTFLTSLHQFQLLAVKDSGL